MGFLAQSVAEVLTASQRTAKAWEEGEHSVCDGLCTILLYIKFLLAASVCIIHTSQNYMLLDNLQ